MSEMNKKGKVDWSKIDGSSPKPKRLRLGKEETDGLYHGPIRCVITMDLKVNVAAVNM